MSDSYWATPNVNVPLNNREAGTIAEVAKDQLRPYQVAANTWPIDYDDICRRCHKCGQNLWFYADTNGTPFFYQPGEITSLIVAHIRQIHEKEITS
jgi:hypothetical protein